ncbi:MAG: hypothetical protein HUK19_08670 [Fibrobacter sp.]|nr:hypothetical protein [Fibrobacter sp.]
MFVKKNVTILFAAVLLGGCAQSLNVSKKKTFEPGNSKTGIIGVFRQPVGFCSGGYQQRITLGGEAVVAKPTWTSKQDNIFSAYIEPGEADLQEYRFSCGFTQTTLTLKGKHGVVIPEKGFCKIVISFLKGDELFSESDELLRLHFKENDVAVSFDDIPYCKTY